MAAAERDRGVALEAELHDRGVALEAELHRSRAERAAARDESEQRSMEIAGLLQQRSEQASTISVARGAIVDAMI